MILHHSPENKMIFTKFKTALDVFKNNLDRQENVNALLKENEKLKEELNFYKQDSKGKMFDL
jgi:cell shape-determining protein MreC